MKDFVFTVDAFNALNNEKLDTSHHTITVRNAQEAEEIMTERIENANRTIQSVVNRIIDNQVYQRGICSYLDRNLICMGHPVVTPLKQERGGNEQR